MPRRPGPLPPRRRRRDPSRRGPHCRQVAGVRVEARCCRWPPVAAAGLGGGGLCVDGVRASGDAEFWGSSHPVDCSPVPAAACTARCLPAPGPAPCLGDAIAASRCRLAALLRRCAVAMLHNYARKQIPELIPQLIMADA